MLIACTTLFESRYSPRQSDGNVSWLLRTAVAAERGSLVGQLLAESICLAAVRGVIGVAISVLRCRGVALVGFRPAMPRSSTRSTWIRWSSVSVSSCRSSADLFGTLPPADTSQSHLTAAGADGSGAWSDWWFIACTASGDGRGTSRFRRHSRGIFAAARELRETSAGAARLAGMSGRVGLPRAAVPEPPRVRDFYGRLLGPSKPMQTSSQQLLLRAPPFASVRARGGVVGESGQQPPRCHR